MCERLRDQVSDLMRGNSAAMRAIDARDWAADDECAERWRYLRACWDELDERARACRRFEHAQWTGIADHRLLRQRLLGCTLRAARDGSLTPEWRAGLDAEIAAEVSWARRAFLPPLPDSDVAAVRDVATLVVHELSTTPPQLWEPYVAGGDWRAALAAWYHDSLQLHEWRSEQQAAAREWSPRWARECDDKQAAHERVEHARGRDALEASYRAWPPVARLRTGSAGTGAGSPKPGTTAPLWRCTTRSGRWRGLTGTARRTCSACPPTGLLSNSRRVPEFSRGAVGQPVAAARLGSVAQPAGG